MKKNEVKVGGTYAAKVSGKVVSVRIDGENRHGGWDATNQATGKKVRIKSAQRLRAAVKTAKAGGKKTPKPRDPNRCATPRCKGEPALTHLGKPLCQKCWERHCEQDAREPVDAAVAIDATAKEIAKTVQAGNLAEGVTIPTPAKKKQAKRDGDAKPKRLGALHAAAEVLKAEGKPMRAKEMIETMAAKGLWTSPNGKTPEATLYAAIIREIRDKGDEARFQKVERGLFAFHLPAPRGQAGKGGK